VAVPVSVEDYLLGEEHAKRKHEYVCGKIHAQAGGTNAHNAISSNVLILLGSQLRGKRCSAFNSDTKIRIQEAAGSRFYYPDASVVCDENPPRDTFQDSPVLIVEVLSPNSRRIDEEEKRQAYLSLNSLKYYLLVEQSEAAAVLYSKSGEKINRTVYTSRKDAIEFPDIACSLILDDMYEGVTFPELDHTDSHD